MKCNAPAQAEPSAPMLAIALGFNLSPEFHSRSIGRLGFEFFCRISSRLCDYLFGRRYRRTCFQNVGRSKGRILRRKLAAYLSTIITCAKFSAVDESIIRTQTIHSCIHLKSVTDRRHVDAFPNRVPERYIIVRN
jgi:hypothetical protein